MLEKIRKITIFFIFFASLVFTVQTIACVLEGDTGWHLRFGKDAVAGNFQYLDSYTWTHFGMPWTNHEWGGDIIFWLLYSKFGYFALVLLVAVALAGAMILILKTFSSETDYTAALVLFLSLFTLRFLTTARLAMLGPLFLALIILTLEKLPTKKTYYWWPFIFWSWATIHGSWILAVIVINIYFFGNIASSILKKYYPQYAGKETGWDIGTLKRVATAEIISIFTLIINPYGLKIYREVLAYFTENYYKQFITEWIPSYSYPIYAGPLIMAAVAFVFIIWGYKQKKVSLPQLLLFCAFFFAALRYKRNNLYLVLVCAPILAATARVALARIKINKVAPLILLPVSVILILYYGGKINFTNNVWEDKKTLSNPRFIFPYDAVKFLQNKIGNEKTYIFNEFWWGGYLNWNLPNALVFLDGRGTATWHFNETETTLERYRKIKFEAGGLKELESTPAQYVILEKEYANLQQPGLINRLLFNKEDLKKIANFVDRPQLIKMLDKSKKWRPIYEDAISKIWQRVSP